MPLIILPVMLLGSFIGIITYLYFRKEEHKSYSELFNLLAISFLFGFIVGNIGLGIGYLAYFETSFFTHFFCSLPGASNLCGLAAPVVFAILGYLIGVFLYLSFWITKPKE